MNSSLSCYQTVYLLYVVLVTVQSKQEKTVQKWQVWFRRTEEAF